MPANSPTVAANSGAKSNETKWLCVVKRFSRCKGRSRSDSVSRHEFLVFQELASDLSRVAMLAIDGIIQLLHFAIGDLVHQLIQGGSDLWVFTQDLLANDRHGLIGREVMFVVGQHEKIKSGDKAVGCVACGQIDLTVFQGPC